MVLNNKKAVFTSQAVTHYSVIDLWNIITLLVASSVKDYRLQRWMWNQVSSFALKSRSFELIRSQTIHLYRTGQEAEGWRMME